MKHPRRSASRRTRARARVEVRAVSPRVPKVFVAPGNGGTATRARRSRTSPLTDIAELVDFAQQEQIDLTIVGPEAPLAVGVVDAFRAAGLRLRPDAARRRSSKAPRISPRIPEAPRHSDRGLRDVHAMRDRGDAYVARAAARRSSSRPTGSPPARAWSSRRPRRSASPRSTRCWSTAVRRRRRPRGHRGIPAGRGSELHRHGRRHEHAAARDSQDHKRLRDGDAGPNTGGMGAYSPAPVVTPQMHARIMREVIEPTISGLAADGTPYTGFLYAGMMVDADGTPNVLEFNCRFGDPETQPIMMRLKSDLSSCRARARRHARSQSRPSGTRAPRSASCSPRTAIRTSRARATRSPGSTPAAD